MSIGYFFYRYTDALIGIGLLIALGTIVMLMVVGL